MKVKSYFGPGGPPEHWETSSGATRDAGSTDVYEEEREESKEADASWQEKQQGFVHGRHHPESCPG